MSASDTLSILQLLRDQDVFYEGIWKYSPDPMFVVRAEADGDFIVEATNPAFDQTIDIKGTGFAGKPLTHVVKAGLLGRLLPYFRQSIEARSPVSYEIVDSAAGREPISWDTRLVPLLADDGQVVRLFGASRNVSALRKIEAALRVANDELERNVSERTRALLDANRQLKEQKNLYQALVDAQSDVSEGLCIIANGRIVFVNEALCLLIGYTEEELKAMPTFLDPIHPDDRERVLFNHKRRLAGEQFENRYEIRMVHKSGAPLEAEIAVAYVIREGQGHLVVVVSDIRARKMAERTLLEAKEAAERSNAAKSRFLASASHDLRQPMQALTMLNASLKLMHLDAPASRVVDLMDVSIRALRELLDALLDISKLEAGIVEPELQALDIGDIFQRLKEEFRPQIEASRLGFRTRYPKKCIRSDPTLLLMILRNLIANAVHHSSRGGILLAGRLRGNSLLIQVWDTGIGIPEGELDNIFQEFYQVGNPARDRRKGLGLGLAIVERVAKLLETEVRVRSRPGRGSVFELTVPITVAAGVSASVAGAHPPGRPARVLVIEDDPAVLNSTGILLRQMGHIPLQAENIEEAMTLVAPGRAQPMPDMILADYRLPGNLTGGDAIELIRRRLKTPIPGILVTGDTAPERLQEAKRSGYQLLHKPVDPGQLETILNRLLAV